MKGVGPHTDPRFKEELRGMADGTGIPLAALRRAHMLPVVSDYSCSSIAAWGEATKDGHLYQTRNLDWEMHVQAQDHPCIVVYIPNEGIPHVNVTFVYQDEGRGAFQPLQKVYGKIGAREMIDIACKFRDRCRLLLVQRGDLDSRRGRAARRF